MVVGGEVVDDLDEEVLGVVGVDLVVDDLVVVVQVESGNLENYIKIKSRLWLLVLWWIMRYHVLKLKS